MRTVRVKEESSESTLLWVLAGSAVGVLAGILVAERMSGRKLTARGVLRRGRTLALQALERGEELMAAAMQLREAWGGADGEEEEEWEDDEEDEEEEEELEEEDAEEDEGEDLEEEGEGADEDDLDEPSDEIDERVLEAFVNDPILSQRAIEIEAEDGRVELHGRVHSAREVQHAVTLARGVPGVVDVRQRLRVRPHR